MHILLTVSPKTHHMDYPSLLAFHWITPQAWFVFKISREEGPPTFICRAKLVRGQFMSQLDVDEEFERLHVRELEDIENDRDDLSVEDLRDD